jgi:hypothetical protein
VDEEQRYQLLTRSQQATKAACARWLGHKATRKLVEAERKDVLDRLWPLIWPLVSNDIRWPVAFALATCGGMTRGDVTFGPPSIVYSDGTRDRPADRWLEALSTQDRKLRHRALDLVREMASIAATLAQRLNDAGVPILVDEPSDQTSLVLLLLLHPDDFDWADPETLAERLAFLPEFGYLAAGSAITFSDRMNVRQRRDADVLRRDYRQRQPDCGAVERNRGGRPRGSATKGSDAELLASVLPRVLERFPSVTASQLRRQWTGLGDGPGRMLRELMCRNAADQCPSLRSIERALKDIRDR